MQLETIKLLSHPWYNSLRYSLFQWQCLSLYAKLFAQISNIYVLKINWHRKIMDALNLVNILILISIKYNNISQYSKWTSMATVEHTKIKYQYLFCRKDSKIIRNLFCNSIRCIINCYLFMPMSRLNRKK